MNVKISVFEYFKMIELFHHLAVHDEMNGSCERAAHPRDGGDCVYAVLVQTASGYIKSSFFPWHCLRK